VRYTNLIDKINKYSGKRVIVTYADRKKEYPKTLHMIGTVKNCSSGSEIGVLLDGISNLSSRKGLFWYFPYELEFVDELKENGGLNMEGNFKIAVVNLLDDCYKKDYGFALYDVANVSDLVVVNPRSSYSLGTIKQILTKEEYGSPVTKEVIGVVSMDAYNKRVEDRERAAKLEKEKKELQKELDKKIAKLKDLEFYERMAKELGDKDPEISEMVSKLKELS